MTIFRAPFAIETGTRIGDIEVLRAVAVLFVMIWHFGTLYPGVTRLTLWIISGSVRFWDGVDLFFAISGFVIARGLLGPLGPDQRQATAATLKRFWARRVFRLWPAAWLWLAVIVAASALVDLPASLGTLRNNAWGAAAAIALAANFRFAHDAASLTYYGAAFPYWTLSLEEQFYVLLPLVIRSSGRLLPIVLALGIVVQFPLVHGPWLQAFRTAALLWGVAIAVFERSSWHRRLAPVWLARLPLLRLAIAGALLWMLARGRDGVTAPWPFEFGIIALVAACLVWLASYDLDILSPGAWLKPVALWVGSRSYALYLAHIPCFILASGLTRGVCAALPALRRFDLPIAVVAAALLVICLAEATYTIVEVPMRRLGWRMADRMHGPNTIGIPTLSGRAACRE